MEDFCHEYYSSDRLLITVRPARRTGMNGTSWSFRKPNPVLDACPIKWAMRGNYGRAGLLDRDLFVQD
jgi:hypothetical protein